MKTRYGDSFWLTQFHPKRRPAYPRHRGHINADVVIVGGGMIGCSTAYGLAVAGASVVLIEAGSIGQASTAASTGLLMQEPAKDYKPLEERYGKRVAQRIWQMTRRAMLDFAATLRRLRVRCQLDGRDGLYIATKPDHVLRLRRELSSRRAAGLEASTWLTADRVRQQINFSELGAIRTRGNGQLDPYRACLGLAAAAAARGALIRERSAATRIRFDRTGVEIQTKGGTLRARRVVIATGTATPLFKSLNRHLQEIQTYAVMTPPLNAKIRAELGRCDAMVRDTEEPYHYLRWNRDGRILFGGADQPRTSGRQRGKILVQRAGQLMYELSTWYPVISGIQPEYAWDQLITTTADGLPYIGPHRNYPHHLFALGCGGNSLAMSFLASRMLVRYHTGAAAKGDELLGFGR